MGFDVLPAGPVTVGSQQTSPLFAFFEPGKAEDMFLRVIALWRDNEPLGGEAPTFQLRAGSGIITSVGPNSGAVEIRDGTGQAVGSVRCDRLPQDIFLLAISKLVENSEPWKIRIRNNDAEALRFLGFSSRHQNQTLQPWMVLGEPNPHGFFLGAAVRIVSEFRAEIAVRNWGTSPLTFNEDAGAPLGGDDSPVRLVTRSDHVDPHSVGHLTIECDEIRFNRRLTHPLSCNDTIAAHTQLQLEIIGQRPPPSPVNPGGGGGVDPHNPPV